MTTPFIESSWSKEDKVFETTLRPQKLCDFTGQTAIKDRLEVFIGAAKKRGDALGHVLFCGPPGLGKTTLAHILASEMNSKLVVTSGPAIEKAGDLAGILTHLSAGDVLFIDEIHRLSRSIEEYLYPAMEDFRLDLMLDTGPSARSVQVKLNPFTLIGATTRMGLLSSPMLSRFSFSCRLDYYEPEILTTIITRSAKLLQVPIEEQAAFALAKRARGTPRIANNLLRWVRDFVQIKGHDVIHEKSVSDALRMLAIDDLGLDEMDKKILSTIIDHHDGGPVGIKTLAAALGEDDTTLAEVHEPYLMMLGMLKRTQRGREVTKLAYDHLQKPLPTQPN